MKQFDILLPFKLPLGILKVFGFWRTKDSSWTYLIYGIFMHLVFVDIFTLLQFAYLFTFETFEDFANLMSLFPTFIACVFKSLNMFYNLEAIANLIMVLREMMEGQTLSENFKSHLKGADKAFKIFWGAALASCVTGALVPFQQHLLPYRMLFPYNYENSEILFWMSAFYQILVTTSICGAVTVFDTLPVMFMSYIIGMLEQLCERLEALKKQSLLNADEAMNREIATTNSAELVKCVEYHLKIIKLSKRVEEIFSTVLFIQGMMSTLILCTTSFALTIVSTNRLKLNSRYQTFAFQ